MGRLINANGLTATVLEHDAEQVETLRRFGWPVFYGDATRLDLLRTAGAARAKVLVLAIDDVEQSVQVATLVRQHFPQLTVVARARNVGHYYRLRQLGIESIEREVLDASLMSGRRVLELMGWQPHTARNQALRFRQHNILQVDRLAPHQGDPKKLIAMAKQGRAQLEQMWAQEREQRAAQRNRQGWSGQGAKAPSAAPPAAAPAMSPPAAPAVSCATSTASAPSAPPASPASPASPAPPASPASPASPGPSTHGAPPQSGDVPTLPA